MKGRIETDPIVWREKRANRMPLIVNGVGQVGKTHLLRRFGKEYFRNVVYINLETNLAVASFFNSNTPPGKLLRYLGTPAREKIITGETLVIFDETQSYERTLTSLKCSYEETPEFHIAAMGGLLGVAINRQQHSFPVGEMETPTMYPLDSKGYLWARGRALLCEEIRSAYEQMESLPEALHEEAVESYREYLIIGGMPACINASLRTRGFLDVPSIQSEILDNYMVDMTKYAPNSGSVRIHVCYQSIPTQLAEKSKRFQYKVAQRGGSTTTFRISIEWLGLAGVVLKCQRLQYAHEPTAVYVDLSAFKLYMGDVGPFTVKPGISQETILTGAGNLFVGAVAESCVIQQLAVRGYDLYYWESGGKAELGFILQKGNKVIRIEVKAGEYVCSRSLNAFVQAYEPAYCIHFSLKNFGMREKVEYIPLYTALCTQAARTAILRGKKSMR